MTKVLLWLPVRMQENCNILKFFVSKDLILQYTRISVMFQIVWSKYIGKLIVCISCNLNRQGYWCISFIQLCFLDTANCAPN